LLSLTICSIFCCNNMQLNAAIKMFSFAKTQTDAFYLQELLKLINLKTNKKLNAHAYKSHQCYPRKASQTICTNSFIWFSLFLLFFVYCAPTFILSSSESFSLCPCSCSSSKRIRFYSFWVLCTTYVLELHLIFCLYFPLFLSILIRLCLDFVWATSFYSVSWM
jgi:hypothetical protein